MEYPFAHLCQLSQPSPVPSLWAPTASSLVGGGMRGRKALGKPCSATVEPFLCYQPYFQHKYKIQPHTSYYDEIEFYPGQNQHTSVQQEMKNWKQISIIMSFTGKEVFKAQNLS